MALIRYTHEQLLRISQSPLVKKPDGLPNLEALGGLRLDNQQNSQKQRQQQSQDSALNGLGRPSLLQTRHTSKISSGQGLEDIVLGPPKLAFTSARSLKVGDTQPTPTPRDDDGTTERFGFFGRELNSQREKNANIGLRRANRDEAEGWTTARSRKPQNTTEEEDSRWGRSRDRDTPKQEEGEELLPRRNGVGRSKFEQPWLRGDKDTSKEAQGPAWRTRERRDEREWIRGARTETHNDDEPEWMDAAPKNEKQAHTQEDFQRWKERMKASTMGAEEKEAVVSAKVAELKEAEASKPATPAALEGAGLDKLFGMWGETKAVDGKKEEVPAPKEVAKPKSSRFAKMFAQDEPPKAAFEPPIPTSPGGPRVNDADKEGFERILAMLGGGPGVLIKPPGLEEKAAGNGIMLLGAPIEAPKPNMDFPSQHPLPIRHNPLGSREERHAFIEVALNGGRNGSDFGGVPPGFNPMNSSSPNPVIPGSGRITEPPMAAGLPPPELQPRMGNRPESQIPMQNRADMPQREFLLSLMQNTARNAMPPPNQPGGRPEPPNFPGYPDMPPKMSGPPKGMAPPPGFFDNPNFPENQMHQGDLGRKPAQRAPPGFFDDPTIALQRRNTADPQPPRPQLPTNMGIPQQQQQQQLPPELQQHWMKGPQPGMPPLPQGQPGPPPGFNIGGGPGGPVGPGGPRLPPGFGPPNMPPGVGNPQMGHPGMPRGMPGAPMGMPPPQHAAYFNGPPPPGFAPNMMPQMRPGEFQGYGRGNVGGPQGQFGL